MVLDIQAIHLGQTFDYYVEEKYSEAAQPGVMVRVRFGGQRVNGIIWKRTDTSETPESSLRFIERVVIDRVLVSESMRNDATLIADAFGGNASQYPAFGGASARGSRRTGTTYRQSNGY